MCRKRIGSFRVVILVVHTATFTVGRGRVCHVHVVSSEGGTSQHVGRQRKGRLKLVNPRFQLFRLGETGTNNGTDMDQRSLRTNHQTGRHGEYGTKHFHQKQTERSELAGTDSVQIGLDLLNN